MDAAERFAAHFVAELKAEGRDPAFIARHAWRHAPLSSLSILGPDRDRNLARLAFREGEIEALGATPAFAPLDARFYASQKIVLVVVPGFTHETLRNFAWHEQIQRADSPHHVVMLHAPEEGQPMREQEFARGDGLKILYLRYPRSNADSRHIVPAMFSMLRDSTTLARWLTEGRRLVFVGYSYGAPLSLELLAAMNAGELPDAGPLLSKTQAFVGMCGDIGGSYLADDVMADKPRFFSMRRLIAFCARHPFIAKLVGLGTAQLLGDMEGGVRALGHEVRQARLAEFAPKLPAQLRYFSIAAVMPMADYRRRWWQFNLDDYTMYRQAQITDTVTVYQDGQVALPDNLIPEAPQIPPERRTHLGAVRTHHWGVSYRTFNLGRNRFPRPAFYRALIRTISEELASEHVRRVSEPA